MRGSDFLSIVELLETLGSEASLRTQIGRIYYAAYLEARRWCEVNVDYERQRLGREHVEVARHISSLDSRIGDDLAFLRTYRNTADYDLDVSAETLVLQLEDARVRATMLIARLQALTLPGS